MNCSFCHPSQEFADLHIKEFTFWRVELRANQNYLGWSFIVLKRHLEDIIDISPEEQEELFTVTRQVRNAIQNAFHPDRFNYASLGNEVNHVHLQVIPRYKNVVEFDNVTFIDERWGKNYAPYMKDFAVSRKTLQGIKEKIQNSLAKMKKTKHK